MIKTSFDWWFDLLAPLIAPTPIFTIFGVVAVVSLFFILRYEQSNWGHMWGGEGILEFFGAGAISVTVTSMFYLLPSVFWCAVGCAIALFLLAILTKLVKISLGEN
ncbi:hypothetical protein POP15_080 [Pectobacterium phage POP15]|nr:hypothetical protein POP15_080 [Pectobacterium phage POP15]